MPQTLEKLKGHFALALSVRPSVHPSLCASVQNLLRYSLEISYKCSSLKIIDTYFFKSGLSPFVLLCLFLKGHNDICNQDISKTKTAMSFELGQLKKNVF